jgi:hypothetical protein
MIAEISLALSLQGDIKKEIASEMRRDINKMCESKFSIEEAIEAQKKMDAEYEMLFRLLLEEVQKKQN